MRRDAVSSPREPNPAPFYFPLSRAISLSPRSRTVEPPLTPYLLFHPLSIVVSPLSIYQFTWHQPYLDACEEFPSVCVCVCVRLTTPRRNFCASETGRRRVAAPSYPGSFTFSVEPRSSPKGEGGRRKFSSGRMLEFLRAPSTGIMHRDVNNAFRRHNERGRRGLGHREEIFRMGVVQFAVFAREWKT